MTREEAIAILDGFKHNPLFNEQHFEALDMAISALSENKGEWLYDGDCYICNQCKSAFNWWADSQTSNFCPNCGARMKGGE